MSKITDTVAKLAEPIVAQEGCRLWDVEYVKEAGQYYLRVYIDHADGVSIQQCEAVSRALDPVLDEYDPIPDSYVFEVSSAGAERNLKRESDFVEFMDSFVEVKLYMTKDGSKEHTGYLKGYDNGNVEIEEKGVRVTYTKEEIANVRLRIE